MAHRLPSSPCPYPHVHAHLPIRTRSSPSAARTPVPASCPTGPRPPRHVREMSRFTQLMAEVLAGERPPAQMRPLLSQRAYALLLRRAGVYASDHRPRIRRTLLRMPEPDVTEVSAVVDCGTRCRALALRIAFAQDAWLCTHFETDVGRAR